MVPYDVEPDEVFKPLQPNDEGSPDNLTFGNKDISGFIFDHDFTTDNSEIFVYFQNLTILDVNPEINQNIFEFIHQQLSEGGFISNSFELSDKEFANLQNSGLSYLDAAGKILDIFDNSFDNQYDSISSYRTPFNIYFQIYPIYLDSNYITYRQYSYTYTGGAHGITASYLKTFNLASGKELTLSDIVKPEGLNQVHEEAAAHMAYSYPIYENITTVNQYVDSLNVWLGNFYGDESAEHDNEVTISNFPLPNPALIDEGLAFIYQMYTMAPGSDGCPLIVIPYKEIKGCLYPQFEK
ncbi:MAG: hypothetical protein J1E16_08290 [Muribaculaceae bacterium]|nr:hypothetical protein [Muribaculaceae bacterium]